jgi:hypothetical protein
MGHLAESLLVMADCERCAGHLEAATTYGEAIKVAESCAMKQVIQRAQSGLAYTEKSKPQVEDHDGAAFQEFQV